MKLLVAARLEPRTLASLGLDTGCRLCWITDAHNKYLAWHREAHFNPG